MGFPDLTSVLLAKKALPQAFVKYTSKTAPALKLSIVDKINT